MLHRSALVLALYSSPLPDALREAPAARWRCGADASEAPLQPQDEGRAGARASEEPPPEGHGPHGPDHEKIVREQIERLRRQISRAEQRSSDAARARAAAQRNATQEADQAKGIKEKLNTTSQQLRAVQEEIDRLDGHLKAFEDAEASRRAAAGTARHFEWLLALLAGFLGMLTVVGPDAFLESVLSIVGSLVGSLMVAVGVCFLWSPPHMEWALEEDGVFGSMWGFVRGDGTTLGYVVWTFTFALGLLRWHLRAFCRRPLLDELSPLAERWCPALWQELSKASKRRRVGHRPIDTALSDEMRRQRRSSQDRAPTDEMRPSGSNRGVRE